MTLRSGRFACAALLPALIKKWRLFVWILPLRAFINLSVQGDVTGFSPPVVFLLSGLDTLIFWAIPGIVTLENLRGWFVLKRGWQLTRQVLPTVTAAIVINLSIFLIIGVSMSIVVVSVAAFIAQNFFPAVAELPRLEFTQLIGGAVIVAIKFTGVILLPFFGVATTLICLKARHAGGESLRLLLDKLKDAEIWQGDWRKRINQS